MPELKCFSCKEIKKYEQIGFRAECESCGEDLHVCYNCEFYSESSYNECRETSADRIKVKDRSNLCEFFRSSGDRLSISEKKDEILSAAEALFKK